MLDCNRLNHWETSQRPLGSSCGCGFPAQRMHFALISNGSYKKKKNRLLFNFTCRWFDWSAGDFRTPCVPLLTSWQACASLSEWSSRVSHLYNTHKATVKFKNSLTDEPGTPWAPTVFVAARNHLLFHLLEDTGHTFCGTPQALPSLPKPSVWHGNWECNPNKISLESFCSHSSVGSVLSFSVLSYINQFLFAQR